MAWISRWRLPHWRQLGKVKVNLRIPSDLLHKVKVEPERECFTLNTCFISQKLFPTTVSLVLITQSARGSPPHYRAAYILRLQARRLRFSKHGWHRKRLACNSDIYPGPFDCTHHEVLQEVSAVTCMAHGPWRFSASALPLHTVDGALFSLAQLSCLQYCDTHIDITRPCRRTAASQG